MWTRYFLLFVLFIHAVIGFAQRPAGNEKQSKLTGAISGTLLDSISGQPVEYAAVGIIDAESKATINGGLTDDKGSFRITDIPKGQYEVHISFIGYEIKKIRNVKLTPARPDFNIGEVLLKPKSELLEEIQVVGEGALIEAKPDKIVYNAERDVTSRGGDAADVLRKVPMLAVDFDGNVSMRGSENVRVLINGRPSSIFNSNLADALKMMPSDQIKSVEVITSPSAKFDGEGTAGIINIITRKKNIEGMAGSVDLTGGSRHNRGNLSVNYGRGRLGLTLSGGGHYSWPQTGLSEFRREEYTSSSPSLLTQNGTNRSSRLGFRTQAGVEYNFNAFHQINSTVSYRGHNSKNQNRVGASYIIGEDLVDSYQRMVDAHSTRAGFEWELDYKRTFPQKGREWSVAFELDKDDDSADASYDQLYLSPIDLPATYETNNNLNDNLELTLQTDYTHPFSERIKIETGLKATLRDIESDFAFDQFDPDQDSWVIVPERTDIFYYQQDVFAGYVSGDVKIGKATTLIGGLRVETTDLAGDFNTFQNPFSNLYTNVLPSVTLSRKTGEMNQIKVSYNQRIQRPNQRHVNPYVEYNDNRDISFGNPLLTPELVHQVELGTNVFIKGNMISVSVFGRQADDLIENLLSITEEGVSETTYQNFGTRYSAGINLFGSLNLGDVSLRGGIDGNVWNVKGEFQNEALTNTGFAYNGRLNITWVISETLKAEGFGFFRSPSFTVQGKNPNWRIMSFGFKKELLDKRLSVGFNITQPFTENQEFEREITGSQFYQYSRTIRPSRSFGLNVGYRFGKLDFNERSGRKRVNNNDLKEEESGDGGGFNGG